MKEETMEMVDRSIRLIKSLHYLHIEIKQQICYIIFVNAIYKVVFILLNCCTKNIKIQPF